LPPPNPGLYVRFTDHNTSQGKTEVYVHALESGAHTALRYPSRFARICWWCARALIIRHVACSRAGNGHLLALRSPWTWSSREACNPSASPLSPPMKGKQKLSFPLPPKKASKFSARKNLQNSPLRKKKTRFGAIHHLFTPRSRAPFVRG